MAAAFSAFIEKPTAVNLQKVRGLLVADHAYDPYSDDLTQLKNLLHAGKNGEVLALLAKSLPNLLLSPQAHGLAAEAARRSGDENRAAQETAFAVRCTEGILATGDGSEARPFLAARLSDEADLLGAKFATEIAARGLVFHDDQRYDRVAGKDGSVYWFDVSMLLQSEKAAAAVKPAAGRDAPDAKTLAHRGVDAYRAGQNDAALALLSEAIGREPANAVTHVDRGNVWYVKQQYERAIADFSEALRLDPNSATAHCNRALALNMLGGADEALADFDAAIRLQPDSSRAHNGRGRVFQAKGMIDKAIADFDEAIRLDPNYAAAYENRGSAYGKKGNAALADADAAKARQLRLRKAVPPAPPAMVEKTAGN
jgi:tetratricopeptide (TPR) repeat protein